MRAVMLSLIVLPLIFLFSTQVEAADEGWTFDPKAAEAAKDADDTLKRNRDASQKRRLKIIAEAKQSILDAYETGSIEIVVARCIQLSRLQDGAMMSIPMCQEAIYSDAQFQILWEYCKRLNKAGINAQHENWDCRLFGY